MKKRIKVSLVKIAIVIASLTFAGCSSGKGAKEDSTDIIESAAGVTTGSLDKDSVVITIGNTEVTYQEYQVYSYLLQSKYDAMLDSKVWEYHVKEGKTLGTEVVGEIIRLIIQLKVIEKEAKEQKVALTVDEKEEIAFNVNKYLTEIPEADKQKYNLTAEAFKLVLENNVLARMMYDIVTGSVNINILPEEEKVSKVQMICFMTKGTDKKGQEVNVDAASKTALFEKANSVRNLAVKRGSFYTLAEKYSSLPQIDFILGVTDEPKEVGERAFKMKNGEISEVLATENGYYILRCISNGDKDTIKAHREKLILDRQTKAFQESYEKWAKKYEVSVSESILEREFLNR